MDGKSIKVSDESGHRHSNKKAGTKYTHKRSTTTSSPWVPISCHTMNELVLLYHSPVAGVKPRHAPALETNHKELVAVVSLAVVPHTGNGANRMSDSTMPTQPGQTTDGPTTVRHTQFVTGALNVVVGAANEHQTHSHTHTHTHTHLNVFERHDVPLGLGLVARTPVEVAPELGTVV